MNGSQITERFIRLTEYELFLPRRFLLEDNSIETVDWRSACNTHNPVFRLYIPPGTISPLALAENLLKQGFEHASMHLPKGEKFSIRKVLRPPWEIHLRIFEDGFIDSEVEVQREYIQYLEPWRSTVIYEAFWSYSKIYQYLHIFYTPKKMFITNVYEHFRILLKPPERLVKTESVVLLGTIGLVGIAALALAYLYTPKKTH